MGLNILIVFSQSYMSGLNYSLITIFPYKLKKATLVKLSGYYWKRFCIFYMNLKTCEKKRLFFLPYFYIINQITKSDFKDDINQIMHNKKYKYMKLQTDKNLFRKKDSYFLQLAIITLEKSSNLIKEIRGNFGSLKQKNVFMYGKTKKEIYLLNKNKPKNVPAKFWAQRYKLFSKY